MEPDRNRPVSRTVLQPRWADAHGVRYDAVGRASDEIAMDHYETREAHRVLRAPDRSATTSAAHEVADNSASAWALLIETATRPRAGAFDFDSAQVIGPEERIAPRRPTAADAEQSIATSVSPPSPTQN